MKPVNIQKIYSTLQNQNLHAPVAELISIQTQNPEKVLLATILSARTKDETTALAAQRLFAKVSRIQDLNNFSEKELQQLIYPVGFYKTKARHLKQLPLILKEKFNNQLPETIEGLTQLPGVGRKTANIVLAVGFNKPAIAVDVHCFRIPQRMGWFTAKTPYEAEIKLTKLFPKKEWAKINALLVAFGQSICKPVKPRCGECPISNYCKYYHKIYLNSTKRK